MSYIIGIDGRCGAGKSTFGEALCSLMQGKAALVHMDDFYLPPGLRVKERFEEPGGNVHYERFLEEVLAPYRREGRFVLRRYRFHELRFLKAEELAPEILIVEGSYAFHPTLVQFYDYKFFLDIDPQTQLARIEKRNGPEGLKGFVERWIPLEEAYFSACDVQKQADLVLRLGQEERN